MRKQSIEVLFLIFEFNAFFRLLKRSKETLRSTVEASPSKPGVSWSAVWCRCVLVQFGHLLAPHVAVGPPVSSPNLALVLLHTF